METIDENKNEDVVVIKPKKSTLIERVLVVCIIAGQKLPDVSSKWMERLILRLLLVNNEEKGKELLLSPQFQYKLKICVDSLDVQPDILVVAGSSPWESPVWNEVINSWPTARQNSSVYGIWFDHDQVVDHIKKTGGQLDWLYSFHLRFRVHPYINFDDQQLSQKHQQQIIFLPMWIRQLEHLCLPTTKVSEASLKVCLRSAPYTVFDYYECQQADEQKKSQNLQLVTLKLLCVLSDHVVTEQKKNGSWFSPHELLNLLETHWYDSHPLKTSFSQAASAVTQFFENSYREIILERAAIMYRLGYNDRAHDELNTLPDNIHPAKTPNINKGYGIWIDVLLALNKQEGLPLLRATICMPGFCTQLSYINRYWKTLDNVLLSTNESTEKKSLQTYILNLKRRPELWQGITRQLDQFNLTTRLHVHVPSLDYIRIEAVDGLKDLKPKFPRSTPIQFRSPPTLAWGTIGCWMTHLKIWKTIVQQKTNKWYLVLEDDAIFGPMFARDITMLRRLVEDTTLHDEWDILWLGVHLNPFDRCHALMNTSLKFFTTPDNHPTQTEIGGTFGYLISDRGARNLLQLYDQETSINTGIDTWMVRQARLPISDQNQTKRSKQMTMYIPTIFSSYFIKEDERKLFF